MSRKIFTLNFVWKFAVSGMKKRHLCLIESRNIGGESCPLNSLVIFAIQGTKMVMLPFSSNQCLLFIFFTHY